MAGRYTNQPNLDIFLKGHAGDPVRIDRKGRDPEYLASPALTMCLAVQPSILRSIGERDDFRGTGLLARNLYACPKPMVGHRDLQAPPVEPPIQAAYERLLHERFEEVDGLGERAELTVANEAKTEYATFYDVIEQGQQRGARFALMRDWASKLPGAVLRIAGLLHFLALGLGAARVIGVETMRAAIRIGTFFLAHAITAYGIMSGRREGADADYVLGWIERQGVTRFTMSDVKRSLRWDRERLAAALTTLCEHGYARILDPSEYYKGNGRPPSTMLELRPSVPELAATAEA